jgi:hypothetical protein
MSFLGGATTGTGGQNQYQTTSQTQSTSYPDWYQNYVQNILGQAQNLGAQPFQAYPVSQMFAPFTADQLQAFQQIRNNQGAYQPYIGAATQALNNVSGYDPFQQGMPYIGAAGQGPTALQAGAPGVAAGMQTWDPFSQSQYMNPYATGALQYAQQLAGQQFGEQTLPAINTAFIKSGGGAGGARYTDFMNRAVRDYTASQMGQANTALSQNYWNAANQFNTDMQRQMSGGLGMGQLANTTMGALGNLGQQAANITSGAVQTGTGLAGAYSGLGGALSNLNLTNTNALLQAGQMQQAQAQQPLTAAYNQYQQGVQWPYQMVNFMNAAQRGLQIPTTQTGTSTAQRYGSAYGTPSPLSTLTGLGMAGASIYGATQGGGGGNPADAGVPGSDQAAQNAANTYGPVLVPGARRGGYIRNYRRGGPVHLQSGGALAQFYDRMRGNPGAGRGSSGGASRFLDPSWLMPNPVQQRGMFGGWGGGGGGGGALPRPTAWRSPAVTQPIQGPAPRPAETAQPQGWPGPGYTWDGSQWSKPPPPPPPPPAAPPPTQQPQQPQGPDYAKLQEEWQKMNPPQTGSIAGAKRGGFLRMQAGGCPTPPGQGDGTGPIATTPPPLGPAPLPTANVGLANPDAYGTGQPPSASPPPSTGIPIEGGVGLPSFGPGASPWWGPGSTFGNTPPGGWGGFGGWGGGGGFGGGMMYPGGPGWTGQPINVPTPPSGGGDGGVMLMPPNWLPPGQMGLFKRGGFLRMQDGGILRSYADPSGAFSWQGQPIQPGDPGSEGRTWLRDDIEVPTGEIAPEALTLRYKMRGVQPTDYRMAKKLFSVPFGEPYDYRRGGAVGMAQGGTAFGPIVSPIATSRRRMAAGGVPQSIIGVNSQPRRRSRGALSVGPSRPMPPNLPGMLPQNMAMPPAMSPAMPPAMPGMPAPKPPGMARGGYLTRMR